MTAPNSSGRWGPIWAFPWYPPLLVAAQVFALYAGNPMSIVATLRPLLFLGALVIGLTVLFGLILRSLHRGGLAAGASVLFLRAGDISGNVQIVVLAVGLAAGLLVLMRLARVKRPLLSATRGLNTVSAFLLLVVLSGVVLSGRLPEIVSDLDHGMSIGELRQMEVADPFADPGRPDVYMVMLDGYPRQDTLRRLFSFDNGPFLDALAARGFDVADGSRSNYMYTSLTLASMLNMRHIADLPITQFRDLRRLINHGAVLDEFRSRGYLVAATAAGWESEAMRNADVYCGGDTISDFELNLVGTSLAGRLLEIALPNAVSDRDRASINGALDCIHQVAEVRLGQPRFVFAHVPAPHLPIVIDRDGGPAPAVLYGHTAQELAVSHAEFTAGYTSQLEYLNDRVIAAVGAIRAASATPPVIILFSDHGSESRLDWGNALQSDMDERFSNLFAASTPGAQDLFGDAPTPVNVFPQLFNRYYGTTIPLTHDGQYVSTVQDRLGLSPR